ncbi:MAG: hypothetical protein EXR95_02545 [Gemmatimonadetes bacterium]|nr:hypothetical protein [Gemmatimonadota bacterium]
MKYAAFQAAAERAYAEIPEAYKVGIEGLVVSREAVSHPDLPDIFTLGECLTESWPSEWQGPETTRSSVVLYWGSFRTLEHLDPEFDWEGEIWETLTHELRHHLESLASEDQLEEVDYAVDEDFKRGEGLAFDPWYWQHGDPDGRGAYRIERHVFLEQEWSDAGFAAATTIAFEWDRCRWTIPRPDRLGDVHFILVDGATEPPETLELVLVRRRSWWQSIRGALGAGRPEVIESEAVAAPE